MGFFSPMHCHSHKRRMSRREKNMSWWLFGLKIIWSRFAPEWSLSPYKAISSSHPFKRLLPMTAMRTSLSRTNTSFKSNIFWLRSAEWGTSVKLSRRKKNYFMTFLIKNNLVTLCPRMVIVPIWVYHHLIHSNICTDAHEFVTNKRHPTPPSKATTFDSTVQNEVQVFNQKIAANFCWSNFPTKT